MVGCLQSSKSLSLTGRPSQLLRADSRSEALKTEVADRYRTMQVSDAASE
jgi:hypothetical protein